MFFHIFRSLWSQPISRCHSSSLHFHLHCALNRERCNMYRIIHICQTSMSNTQCVVQHRLNIPQNYHFRYAIKPSKFLTLSADIILYRKVFFDTVNFEEENIVPGKCTMLILVDIFCFTQWCNGMDKLIYPLIFTLDLKVSNRLESFRQMLEIMPNCLPSSSISS